MRPVNVYYLKILCFCAILSVERIVGVGNAAAITTETIYKKILKMRTLPFEDCGSRYDILYLSISSCTTIPCEMHRGSTVLVNVLFDDDGSNTTFLKHQVRWIFNAVKTTATISPDPCNGDQECIVKVNDGKSYFASLIVNSSLPVLGGTMLWEAVDEYNKDVICFKVPVIIIL